MNIIWYCQDHKEYYLALYKHEIEKHAECNKFDLLLADVVIYLNHYIELRESIGLFWQDGEAWKIPERFEGFQEYSDPTGKPTIGYGKKSQ